MEVTSQVLRDVRVSLDRKQVCGILKKHFGLACLRRLNNVIGENASPPKPPDALALTVLIDSEAVLKDT